ncbi:hypothetical protein VP01_10129g1, partial [Puccinia sorghi]
HKDPVGHSQPFSVEEQVGVGLYWLAHGTTYVTIAHVFCIGKETADKASGRFVNAVIKVFGFERLSELTSLFLFPFDMTFVLNCAPTLFEASNLLTMPQIGAKEWSLLRGAKEYHWFLGQLMGHIYPSSCLDENWKSYINQKSWASIVFQCVVDGDGNFAIGGGAGSMHDSRVFRRSILGQSLRSGARIPPMIPRGTFLVGDAGYPGNVNILLPYPSV